MKFFLDGCVWDLITRGSEQEENRIVKGNKVYDHVTERFNYPQIIRSLKRVRNPRFRGKNYIDKQLDT